MVYMYLIPVAGVGLSAAFFGDPLTAARVLGGLVVLAGVILTRVALDASNRPYLIWKVNFTRDKLGTMDTELFKEWFQAFAQLGGLTLHVWNHYGDNNHHIVESCFKGLARALRVAVEIDPRQTTAVPSTKGVL